MQSWEVLPELFVSLRASLKKTSKGAGEPPADLGPHGCCCAWACPQPHPSNQPPAPPVDVGPFPAQKDCLLVMTNLLHGMAEAVGRWQQQGCLKVGMGPDWRRVGWEPSTKLFPALGRSCHLHAPGSWLRAISCLVPVNYQAPGSLPYLGFCRSQGLKLSRSLGKPFPLLK